MRLLDIACGSGLALRRANAMGAEVAGIDAAAELVDIARTRNPDADIRLGSMFELPWPDATFDAAVSINGIWGGCDAALHEARRVLRPGGLIAISFWGPGPPLDLRGLLADVRPPCSRRPPADRCGTSTTSPAPVSPSRCSPPPASRSSTREQRISTLEWPDADLAWRALSSVGPAVPALRHSHADAVRRDVLDAIAACRDRRGTYRFRNDHQIVIAHRMEEPS